MGTMKLKVVPRRGTLNIIQSSEGSKLKRDYGSSQQQQCSECTMRIRSAWPRWQINIHALAVPMCH